MSWQDILWAGFDGCPLCDGWNLKRPLWYSEIPTIRFDLASRRWNILFGNFKLCRFDSIRVWKGTDPDRWHLWSGYSFRSVLLKSSKSQSVLARSSSGLRSNSVSVPGLQGKWGRSGQTPTQGRPRPRPSITVWETLCLFTDLRDYFPLFELTCVAAERKLIDRD